MYDRMKRVDSMIQQEFGNVILEYFNAPQSAFVTITKVKTSKDLSSVRVWVSVLPFDKAELAFGALIKQKSHLQYELHQRINLRISPKVMFSLDTASQKADRIESLLDSLKENE